MCDKSNNLFDSVINAWQISSEKLGIRVIVLNTLSTVDGMVMQLIDLPDFGSPKGMLISFLQPPIYQPAPPILNYLKSSGKFWTLINADIYAEYDEIKFKEALYDWGFYGSDDRCPRWFRDGKRHRSN
jgi:hypothetical protein